MRLKFAIVGGDARLVFLAVLLWRDGHRVCTYALERAVHGQHALKALPLDNRQRRHDGGQGASAKRQASCHRLFDERRALRLGRVDRAAFKPQKRLFRPLFPGRSSSKALLAAGGFLAARRDGGRRAGGQTAPAAAAPKKSKTPRKTGGSCCLRRRPQRDPIASLAGVTPLGNGRTSQAPLIIAQYFFGTRRMSKLAAFLS